MYSGVKVIRMIESFWGGFFRWEIWQVFAMV